MFPFPAPNLDSIPCFSVKYSKVAPNTLSIAKIVIITTVIIYKYIFHLLYILFINLYCNIYIYIYIHLFYL